MCQVIDVSEVAGRAVDQGARLFDCIDKFTPGHRWDRFLLPRDRLPCSPHWNDGKVRACDAKESPLLLFREAAAPRFVLLLVDFSPSVPLAEFLYCRIGS